MRTIVRIGPTMLFDRLKSVLCSRREQVLWQCFMFQHPNLLRNRILGILCSGRQYLLWQRRLPRRLQLRQQEVRVVSELT